jgi:hypothetical protein
MTGHLLYYPSPLTSTGDGADDRLDWVRHKLKWQITSACTDKGPGVWQLRYLPRQLHNFKNDVTKRIELKYNAVK